MGACSAPNCKSRTAQGVRVFGFPTAPERRNVWTQNCRRAHWIPNSSSRLCELHFDEDQWERKRQDGWRKLKPNAIPTLFELAKPQSRLNSQKKTINQRPNIIRKSLLKSPAGEKKTQKSLLKKREHLESSPCEMEKIIYSSKELVQEWINLPHEGQCQWISVDCPHNELLKKAVNSTAAVEVENLNLKKEIAKLMHENIMLKRRLGVL